jgi:predicted Zn-dependent peptidase
MVAHSAIAQQTYTWKEGKSGNYSYKYVDNDPLKTRFYTLPNGLTVILSVNKQEPRLQTMIATKAGSKTDPSDHTGLAHYLEHMLFKGTTQYGSLDWAKEKPYLDMIDNLYEQYNSTTDEAKRRVIYHNIDSVSGVAAKFAIANEYDKMMTMLGAKGTNAFTSFEVTCYVNDIPTNQVDRWLAIEAERFRDPVFRIFHTELEAVYEEKNISLDNDGEKVFETLFANLFQKHNYGLQTTIGTVEDLKNPSLNEIRKYFHNYYVPNNMCVIMSGDINPDELIAKVDKSFGYMKPQEVKAYQFQPEAPITAPIEKTVYGPESEYIDMAFRFPGASSEDAMMLDLMANVLSNGQAGIMDLNLVKKQKVLEASAGSYALKDYSVLFIEGKAKEGQTLDEVKGLMLAQLEALKNGNFDESLIPAIVNNVKKNMQKTFESNRGRASAYLDAFVTDISWDKQLAYYEKMSAIKKADIVSFAKKWLGNNYVAVYKRTGEDKNVVKVEKPTITPVEVNRAAQSDFVTNIQKMPVQPIQPVYVDFATDIQRGKLGASTEVLGVQNQTNNLFTQYYYFEMGRFHNKLLPLAVSYLQYLGTDKMSADEISKAFYAQACDFDVSAGDEETYVYIDGLNDNYKTSVSQFEQLLRNCKPDQEALKEMIADIRKKRSDNKLDKGIIRSGMMSYAQYGSKNPFNDVMTDAELDNIKAEDLIAILHNLGNYPHKVLYYGPQKVNEPRFTTMLASLHPLPQTFTNIPAKAEYTRLSPTKPSVLFADYDMVQTELVWYKKQENYTPTLAPSISLFNEYFGGGMSGVVFQTIRESKALAYSTYATFGQPGKKEDPFYSMAYIGCQADKMNDAMGAMNELLNKLPESDKMVDQARVSIKNNISTTRIIKSNILFTYLRAQRLGLNYDIRKNVYDGVDKLKFADINKFHQQHFANQPYTMTVLGSEKKVSKNDLEKSGPVKTLSLKEIFGY